MKIVRILFSITAIGCCLFSSVFSATTQVGLIECAQPIKNTKEFAVALTQALVGAQLAEHALDAFTAGRLQELDGVAGDSLCHTRASQLIQYAKTTTLAHLKPLVAAVVARAINIQEELADDTAPHYKKTAALLQQHGGKRATIGAILNCPTLQVEDQSLLKHISQQLLLTRGSTAVTTIMKQHNLLQAPDAPFLQGFDPATGSAVGVRTTFNTKAAWLTKRIDQAQRALNADAITYIDQFYKQQPSSSHVTDMQQLLAQQETDEKKKQYPAFYLTVFQMLEAAHATGTPILLKLVTHCQECIQKTAQLYGPKDGCFTPVAAVAEQATPVLVIEATQRVDCAKQTGIPSIPLEQFIKANGAQHKQFKTEGTTFSCAETSLEQGHQEAIAQCGTNVDDMSVGCIYHVYATTAGQL